jgi:uncharacterized membrane protein YqjE
MSSANRWDTLIDSMRSLLSTSIALIHTRVELIGVEIETELWRARSLIIWGFAALLLTLLAIGFAGVALIVTYWDTPHRELVSALVAAGFALLAVLAVFLLVRTLRAKPRLFEGTLRELEHDLESVRREP